MKKSVEMEIGFSMEPADTSVGIMSEGFAAWLLKGTAWCNMTNYADDLSDTTFEWFDNESGTKLDREELHTPAPTRAAFVEATLWAFARSYYAQEEDAYSESGETEKGE